MCHTGLSLFLAWVHAVVDAEVAANHVCGLGGFVARLVFCRIGVIGAVFPVVDSDSAGPAIAGSPGLEEGIWPAPAVAEICNDVLTVVR